MDLQELKQQYILEELGITDSFGRVCAFVDFGNVNYWFHDDRQTQEHIALADNQEFYIDIEKLRDFLRLFSTDVRFYYGRDSVNTKYVGFIQKAQSFLASTGCIPSQFSECDTISNQRSSKTLTHGRYTTMGVETTYYSQNAISMSR